MTTSLGARLVVAGVSSGVGKTTVATGLMAALRHRGLRVAGAKVGPDFIDPGYHSLATGRPGRNLDSWLCGEASIPTLAGRAGAGSDILVVEGVMGLFDGAANGSPEASTASIARLLDAPIVLVVDASAMSSSVAAVVHGFDTFDDSTRVAGVILNRVGSDRHEMLLREALAPLAIPVLGALRRSDAFTWRHRHLGLVPVVEDAATITASLQRLAEQVSASVDLDAVVRLARGAPTWHVESPRAARRVGACRVAVAAGPAFSFTYPDNLEALASAGAELLPFDPRRDEHLPAGATALYAGGGFPEVFASDLAANEALRDDLQRQVGRGLVVWAECGGLLWLAQSLDGHRLAGLIAAQGVMSSQLTLGYRSAEVLVDNPLGAVGDTLRGHEFHYSTLTPSGTALRLRSRGDVTTAGYAGEHLFASYLHLHLGGDPTPAERFVTTADASSSSSAPNSSRLRGPGAEDAPPHLSRSSW